LFHAVDTALVLSAAFAAGCIDAIAGGGGLIQLPALFAVYPDAAPTTLLGTNKFASIFGTSNAVRHYSKIVSIPWRMLLPLMVLVLVASGTGALLATHLSPEHYRPLVPVLLIMVLIIILRNKHLGNDHQPRLFTRHHYVIATMLIAGIGFYDGFFGPGTGSFFMFVFVRVYGYDFINAAASARVLNVMTNVAAIILFAATAKIMWLLGAAMAVSNIVGSTLGTHLAMRGGNLFIRKVFVAIVVALIVRTIWVIVV
jgi:uncharacterized membrane protein YfcA